MSDYERFKSMLTDLGIAFEEYSQDGLIRKWIYVADPIHKYFHSFEFMKETGKFNLHYINKE